MSKRPRSKTEGDLSHLYGGAWSRASKRHRRENPFCVFCHANGKVSGADVTDHRVPHKGDMTLFWDPTNWQSLCFWCHDNTKRQIERYGYHKLTDFRGWPLDPLHPFNLEKR